MGFSQIKKLVSLVALLAFSETVVKAQGSYPEPSVNYRDRLEIKRQIKAAVDEIVRDEVKVYGEDALNGIKSSIELEFDEEALKKDAKDYYQKAEDIRSNAQNIYSENRVALLKEVEEFQDRIIQKRIDLLKKRLKEVAPGLVDIKETNFRFGRLNIDLKKEALEAIMARDEANRLKAAEQEIEKTSAGTMSLAVSVPSIPVETNPIPDFVFKASLYVNKIAVAVTVPSYVANSIVSTIKKNLVSALELDRISGGSGAQFVKIKKEKLPVKEIQKVPEVAKPSVSDWIASLFMHDNLTIGIVAAAMAIGFFVFLSVIMLGRSLSGVATSIAELKPEEASEGGGGAGESGGGESDTLSIEEEAGGDGASSSRHNYDQASANQALTSEMKTIRSQLAEIIEENPQVCAEVLRDLFYEEFGLEDLRDLLSFAGYGALKGSLNMLPKSCIEELKGFIEDSRENPTSLLNGVEVAQRVYRDSISKVSVGSADGEDPAAKLRDVLVNADDRVLEAVIATASAEEVAVFLNMLTIERGNKILKGIDQEKLKAASVLLDEIPSAELCDGLATKLSETEVEADKTSKAQRRFILRLVRAARWDEEESVRGLIPPEDWELKEQIMKMRYLYSDLKYLKPELLRKTLDSFDIGFRAEFLYLSEEGLKGIIMNDYAEGSKLKDMVQSELSELEKTEKRQAAAEKKRDKIVETYLDKIRKAVNSDKKNIDDAMLAQAKELGISPPEHLAAKAA